MPQRDSGASTVPTFLDNLRSQGAISTEVLGVYFKPESGSDSDDANGELTFGGTDSTKYSGSITYAAKSTSSSVRRILTATLFRSRSPTLIDSF